MFNEYRTMMSYDYLGVKIRMSTPYNSDKLIFQLCSIQTTMSMSKNHL